MLGITPAWVKSCGVFSLVCMRVTNFQWEKSNFLNVLWGRCFFYILHASITQTLASNVVYKRASIPILNSFVHSLLEQIPIILLWQPSRHLPGLFDKRHNTIHVVVEQYQGIVSLKLFFYTKIYVIILYVLFCC